MNYLYEPSKIYLTYGSIISFMLDHTVPNNESIISWVPRENNEFIKIEDNSNDSRQKDFSDVLISRDFLYSQGVFNKNCFFHQFKNKNELKHNYYNSLFLVLPKGEYDSLTKLRILKKKLKKEILMEDEDLDRQQIIDCYTKFKQEIETNQKYSIKLLTSKNNYVNFNDCVQFMHIKSGKFLEFKKHNESLKIYIELTETLSENTLFRFVPAYNYQSENSTKVMINLIMKIACGEKHSIDKEKFLSKNDQHRNKPLFRTFNSNNSINSKKPKAKELVYGKEILLKTLIKVDEAKYKSFVQARNARNSLKDLVNDNKRKDKDKDKIKNNFLSYINFSDLPHKNFGKNILPNDDDTIIAGNRTYNFWRIILFSKNFLNDNKYINSLDYFCIQNIDKNIFIQSDYDKENNKIKKKIKKKIKMEEDDSNDENDSRKIKSIENKKKNTNDQENVRLEYNEQDIDNNPYLINSLIVNHYEENDYIEPLGLFKFEFLYKTGKYGTYGSNPKHHIDILQDNSLVRLINVFTKKVLMVDIEKDNEHHGDKFKFDLINNNIIDKNDYLKTLFIIEKVKDEDEEEDDDSNEIKKKTNLKHGGKRQVKKVKKKTNKINKNELIKIKSKKFNVYLGIRLNSDKKEQTTLVLTDSISDLVKFKLNFLDEIDKYELHFFEQLLMSFSNILNYFKSEKEIFSQNSISLKSCLNYENIQHILITLENKINNFPENNKVNISQKNKFDFMRVIEHFNIVSQLVDIFLANWFKDCKNLNYYEMEKQLEKYFQVSKEEEFTLLKCKKLISKKIFKILRMIYDINRSYLNVIIDRLLYFFMFIGRDDKCTKFLIYILKNNGALLISLCPLKKRERKDEFINNQLLHADQTSRTGLNNQSPYNMTSQTVISQNYFSNSIRNNNNSELKDDIYTCLKHCLKRIINDYNCLNFVKFKIHFSSVFLLFKILNCLLVYNQKPFNQFYDEYFKELDLLNNTKFESSPNYEKNPLFVKFFLKDGKVYIKKRKFFKNNKNNIKINQKPEFEGLDFLKKLKFRGEEEEAYDGLENSSSNSNEFEFELSQLIKINSLKDSSQNYSEIILSKLVSLNILFYSYISLCNQELKNYLQSVFLFENIMNNYLKEEKSVEEDEQKEDEQKEDEQKAINNNQDKKYDVNNDIKCALTQLLEHLYFRISFPFSGKMNLFYCLDQKSEKDKIELNLHSSIIHIDAPKSMNENYLNDIVNYIHQLLLEISNQNIIVNNDPFLLCQILESTKYIIRNLFVYKNDDIKINESIDLMSIILLLLEKFFGASLTDEILGRNRNLVDNLNTDNSLKEKLYLITDNSKLIFEKYRKKLEKIIKSKENISQKKLFKNIFLVLISQRSERKFILNMENYRDRTRSMERLNQYNLSQILMEISISGNVDQKTMNDEILFMISDIFLEFLQYIENLEIDKVFNKIKELSKEQITKRKEQTDEDFYENIIDSIVIRKEAPKTNKNYIDEVINKYLMHKRQMNYGTELYENNISFSFFKFLQLIDNVELKNKILQILYRTNSQKKIFFENITNIVLYDDQKYYKHFEKIKDIFIDMFNTVQSITLIKRLDKNSYTLFEELSLQFEDFINLLFDEKSWRKENNIFNVYGDVNYNEFTYNNKDTDFDIKVLRKKSIFNSQIIKEKNKDSSDDYFLNEFTKEKVSIVQQTLYNLGFIELITQIFEYISWIVNDRKDLEDELISLERILVSIYKILVLFIFDNQKHQFIIREKLYLYICPLKLKIKSRNILLFVGYFLLNVIYFFDELDDFNQINHLDNIIATLSFLQYLHWDNNKQIIPFYVQTFKTIISFCDYDTFNSIYQVLDKINKVLVKEININKYNDDDLISLVKILELIVNEQNKKNAENKNTCILPLYQIIFLFLDLLKLFNPDTVWKYMKLSQILVIVTNLLYNHFQLYKNDFKLNKYYRMHLAKLLVYFSNTIKLNPDLIYCSKNKDNNNLRYFNEFIGISLPRLYILLSPYRENKSYENDPLSSIINLSNKLYEYIIKLLEKDNKEKIFMTKKNKSETDDIIKKVPSLYYLSIIKEKFDTYNIKLSIPKLIKSLKTRKNLINKLFTNDEYNSENFGFIWNQIKTRINYNKGLNNFQNYAKYEINEERMNYIQNMNNFFEYIKTFNIDQDKNALDDIIDNTVVFFDEYIDTLKGYYTKDFINYRNEIYFFYWTNIHLMRFNKKKKIFISNENTLFDISKIRNDINTNDPLSSSRDKSLSYESVNKAINDKVINDNYNYFNYMITPYNKVYFNNLNFIEMTLKQFNTKKIFSSYDYLLYIKFLNSYLDQLDEKTIADFLIFFIKQQETENIFSLMQKILESLDKNINKEFNEEENMKERDKELIDKNKYAGNLFENNFDQYELIIQFIIKMSVNNSIIKNKMKDYLRVQYNNSKSYNFILILSNLLENFTKGFSNLFFINKYYQIIIQIIDCITKCCNGPSIENQDCVVKDTKLLNFAKYILKRITYRKKEINDSGLDIPPSYDRNFTEELSENEGNSENLYEESYDNDNIVDECKTIGLGRQKLSFLKYKVLLLLSVLTIGRKKGDIIFDYIHKIIDFDVLACVIIETYKEILIEKESENHHENLIFDEEMLLRMDKNISYENDENEKFIIFEIGTYTFILINIYLENLNRSIDFKTLEKISSYSKELKEGKYHATKSSIFDSFKLFGNSVYICMKSLCIKCGNCLTEHSKKDFFLPNSFKCSYKFFFDYTPNIEIINDEHIIKYYLKLSPICKCLNEEMKNEFHSQVDRSSTKTKIESLFKNVDYYHYQLVHAKRRIDLFRQMPLLDLMFNHYRFYRDIFMIIGVLLNILLFASLYRTNDDYYKVEKYSKNFNYDYGFLYKQSNIGWTRKIFFYLTFIQSIISVLIFLSYILNRLPNLLYFEVSEAEQMEFYNLNDDGDEEFLKYYTSNEGETFNMDNYDKMRKNVKLWQKILSFFLNIINDMKLIYHLLILTFCLIALGSQNYKFLSFFLVEIIIRSDTLLYTVKSFWIPRKQLIVTLVLFYLIAYYFIIFIYLFIPHHLPTKDCFVFSDCFFTICDQTIKNSNGIINYLVEEGLYITKTLYQNPRFWIDNWFAIIDLMLVLQMICGIIINAYISQKKTHNKIEKDKNKTCFICGLDKNQLNQYYGHEQGFYEHIKLDHYLWNYMFLIFNVIKKNSKNLISIDKNIVDNYKKRIYSTWVPYKKCFKQIEIEGKKNGEEDEKLKDDEDTKDDDKEN